LSFLPLDTLDVDLKSHGFYEHCETCYSIYVAPFVPVTAADIPVPEGEELLPFQVTGINDLLRRQTSLLADEMGLGKTIQVLCMINVLNARRAIDTPMLKVLVICPNSLKLNWKHEAEKWLVDKYDMEVAGAGLFMFSDFTIINYESLQRHDPVIFAHPWDIVIVDEAHYVKNPSSIRAKMVNKVNKNARLVMLTGTPIVNYPFELFPLIHQLDPATWPSFAKFESRYCIGKKYGRNLKELNQRLYDSIMTRRLKKDVLQDLPKKRRQVIELDSSGYEELLDEEKRLWEGKDKSMEKTLMDLVNSSSVSENELDFSAIVEALKYDKRYFFEEISRIRHEVAVAKLPQVIEHLESVLDYIPGIITEGEKIVCFAHHLDVIDALYQKFKPIAVKVVGGQSLEDRDAAVQKFQNDPRCRLFIGGLKVAGVGLTLTAASHAVFAEQDWVPGTLTQAEDRLHRIGQTAESILIQHLVMENSMDSKMIKTTIRKQKQIDQAINKGGTKVE
jgi:SWI/SNF-related matrix-associated actin-dependent regulator 1 of chromatin subfamily A